MKSPSRKTEIQKRAILDANAAFDKYARELTAPKPQPKPKRRKK